MKFKSIGENFRKECLDIKNNTFRKVEDTDLRKVLLDCFITGDVCNLLIEISNPKTNEAFARRVRDVTFWDNYYIITWFEGVQF